MTRRLAVLSDVHGNLIALRAVLADAEALGVDDVVAAGDLVNFGPNSAEVVDLLRDRGARLIRGNHEQDYVAPYGTPVGDARLATDPRFGITRWAMEPLDGDPRACYVVATEGASGVPGDWRVAVRRVAYDVEAAIAAYDNGLRQACPEVVELFARSLRTARDYFGPGIQATAGLADDEVLPALRRFLAANP